MKRFRRIAWLIPIVGLFASAGPGRAQTGQRVAIDGIPPYILGAPMATVLAADPQLTPGGRASYASRVKTTDYGKLTRMPIDGADRPAEITVQFLDGKLGVLIVDWPSRVFGSVAAWRSAGRNIHRQLLETYHPELVTENAFSNGSGVLELRDSRGNKIVLIVSSDHFDVTLIYLSAQYSVELGKTPPPKGNY